MTKLKNNKGSAMVLAIILMAMFLIVAATITSQLNNNLKVNSRTYKESQYKYKAEASIESEISQIYKEIQTFIDSTKLAYEDGTNKDPIDSIPREINCYFSGKRNIYAEIEVIKNSNGAGNGNIEKAVLKRFNTDELNNNLKLQSIVKEDGIDKYKVEVELTFSIDENFNLSYGIKSYNKNPM